MSKTTLAETDGWTPVIDSLVQEYGLTTAAVFGRIWRYCQGERGVCNATILTISRGLGISYNTVLKHIRILLQAGFIEDKTPGLRHEPHVYIDTGKVNTLGHKKASEILSGKNDEKSYEGVGPQKMEIVSAKIEDRTLQILEIKKEVNIHSKRESAQQSLSEIPPSLDTPGFQETWNDFVRYRCEIRKPLSNLTCSRLLTRLSGYPVDTAIQMLNQSIENGWQGVFPVKNLPTRQKRNMNLKNQLSPEKVLELLKETK